MLDRQGDQQLYRAWLRAIDGMTNREVAAAMGDITEAGVSKLRREEPSRLLSRTRRQMSALLNAKGQGLSLSREVTPHGVSGNVTSLSDSSRVWVQRFLLRLTEAGVPDDEIDSARRLLTKSDLISYAHGGAPGMGALSEEQQLKVVKLIAGEVIIPRLKELGRKVSASLAR